MVAASCTGGPGSDQSSSSPSTLVDLTRKSPAPVVAGPLHTRGTQILGPGGESIRFTGINLQGMQISNDSGTAQPDACGRAWRTPPQDAAMNIRAWGFNSVRLPFAWANLEPVPPTLESDGTLTHHWSEEYLTALDTVIASLTAEHLVVILDPAQFRWSSAFKESGPYGSKVACEGYGMPAWLNPDAPNETINRAGATSSPTGRSRESPAPLGGPVGGMDDAGQRYSDNGLRSVESMALDFPGWRLRALGTVLGMGYILRAGFARKATERALARRCLHHCRELMKGRYPERQLPPDADPGKSLGGNAITASA
jgi:cellulase (glycosyl hydrolase family 5)